MSGAEEEIGPLDGEAPGPGGWGMNGQGQMPTMEEIMAFIDQASGISDEEKAEIKEDVIKSHNERMQLMDGVELKEGVVAAAAGGLFAPNTLLFIGLVVFIALILGLFVYKIIKAEKDKGRARELKRKLKEEKKTRKSKRS